MTPARESGAVTATRSRPASGSRPATRTRSASLPVAATMTAILLCLDAVTDVATATSTSDLMTSLAMALCAELPLAGLCFWLAARQPTSNDATCEPAIRTEAWIVIRDLSDAAMKHSWCAMRTSRGSESMFVPSATSITG